MWSSDFGLGAQGAEKRCSPRLDISTALKFTPMNALLRWTKSATRIKDFGRQGVPKLRKQPSVVGPLALAGGVVKRTVEARVLVLVSTANVSLVRDCIPQDGVYACYVVHGATSMARCG